MNSDSVVMEDSGIFIANQSTPLNPFTGIRSKPGNKLNMQEMARRRLLSTTNPFINDNSTAQAHIQDISLCKPNPYLKIRICPPDS